MTISCYDHDDIPGEELSERKTSTVVDNCRSNEVTVLCTMYGETMSENKVRYFITLPLSLECDCCQFVG